MKWEICQNSSLVANFPNSKGPGPSPKVMKKTTVDISDVNIFDKPTARAYAEYATTLKMSLDLLYLCLVSVFVLMDDNINNRQNKYKKFG